MLQTSSPHHPLAVEYVLNWKAYIRYRQPEMRVLQLMKSHGASVHDLYHNTASEDASSILNGRDHPFVSVLCWQKSIKRIVLDMALAQENRESVPGWSIWTICDIIYFNEITFPIKVRLIEGGIWYLHCLELLLLESGPQAYKKRMTAWDNETPFQYLSKRESERKHLYHKEVHDWIVGQAVQLLRPWEDVYIGKRSAPPSIPEHPNWKSFWEWEETWWGKRRRNGELI
jgi:hypothetical protein